MFKWRRGDRRERTAAEETVDVADRLHPYEELFNQAMTMAARFTAERERRDVAPPAVAPVRASARRRAS